MWSFGKQKLLTGLRLDASGNNNIWKYFSTHILIDFLFCWLLQISFSHWSWPIFQDFCFHVSSLSSLPHVPPKQCPIKTVKSMSKNLLLYQVSSPYHCCFTPTSPPHACVSLKSQVVLERKWLARGGQCVCTCTQIHRYTDTQIHRYTDTQIHRYTDTQINRYTDKQIDR